MADIWFIDKWCPRCCLSDIKSQCQAQKWYDGMFRLSCSNSSCGWVEESDGDWSLPAQKQDTGKCP